MPRKVSREYKLYSFDELPDNIRKKVLNELRDINVDQDWYYPIEEGLIEKLNEMGYDDVKISFTGFWSQGDGASFTANVDLEKWLKFNKLSQKYSRVIQAEEDHEVVAKIIRIGNHYVHENTIDAEIAGGGSDDIINAQINEVEKLLKEDSRRLSRMIYNDLGDYYYDLTSDESVADTIRSNEYEFTSDGKVFR